MPIYDYSCHDCGRTYDIFHKVREVSEDIICPGCGSTRHTRLLSAPAIAVKGGAAKDAACENPSSCCGGACPLN